MIFVCCLVLLCLCTASTEATDVARENHERSGHGSQCEACPHTLSNTGNHHYHMNNNDRFVCIRKEGSFYTCDFDVGHCVQFLGKRRIFHGRNFLNVRHKSRSDMWALEDSVQCKNDCCNATLNQASASVPPSLPTTSIVTSTAPPEILKVRLVDGLSALEGRVEVYHNGQWGTVCDDSWDDNDARVVCRMLGYSGVHATHTSKARYGSGHGPIWLDETQCSGTETNLGQCNFVPYGHGDCDHTEDAGVVCQAAVTTTTTTTTTPTSVSHGSLKVRLVDGPSAREGRVEVLHNGVWGTVCDDNWSDADAKVVCRMLGYSTNLATHTSKARYGSGHGPIWLDETQCSGTETNLGQCNSVPYGHGDCDHTEDAGVICQDLTSSTAKTSTVSSTTTTTTASTTTSTMTTTATTSTTITPTKSATAAKTSRHWIALGGAVVG
ncbi:neurotrypsin-like [Mizuhopecten yessoensis]|uniref:neurotrypsin-like n=1 Tax=Mizuhopecten yessoensis TaxID=6573 RepID=UPI000B459F18|nr:neurotrypsin-like [Mizuhopecten yessoensis]